MAQNDNKSNNLNSNSKNSATIEPGKKAISSKQVDVKKQPAKKAVTADRRAMIADEKKNSKNNAADEKKPALTNGKENK
jgi:hypothetical protein